MKESRDVAMRLNSATVHLGRALRGSSTGLPAEHQSVLTAVVYAGPLAIGALAQREGVGAPAMTKTVGILEREHLVRRTRDPADGRVVQVAATGAGKRMVLRGRNARVRRIARALADIDPGDRERLAAAMDVFERLVRDIEGTTTAKMGTLVDRGRARPLSRR